MSIARGARGAYTRGASVSEIILLLFIAATVGLIVVTVLWRNERARADRLAGELASARAKRRPQGGLPPLKAMLETAARVREEGLGEVLRSSIEDLAGLAEEAEPELRQIAARDGTVTIFFSDIEDSTALNEELGDRAWLKVLSAHDKIVRGSVSEHGGHVVKSQGDGFMIAFASPDDALHSAVAIQQRLASSGHRRLRSNRIQVRIGVHSGPAVEKGGDLFGRNVALAARVADQASGGQILVTAEVSEAAEAEELRFIEVREAELKGLPGTYRLLAVEWDESS